MRAVAIVPTYNEADNIETLCRAIRKHAPTVGILVVDDNSPDGTADLAESMGDEIGDLAVLRRAAQERTRWRVSRRDAHRPSTLVPTSASRSTPTCRTTRA